MSCFGQVTKYLDIVKSSKYAGYLREKYDAIVPTRPIKKLFYSFVLPQSEMPSGAVAKCLARQFNYSMPFDFYITEFTPQFSPEGLVVLPIVCIRYRIGTQVFRYRLHYNDKIRPTLDSGLDKIPYVNAPVYNGELIKKNFVIELWSVLTFYTQAGPTLFQTSVARLPSDANEIEPITGATGVGYARSELVVALPEAIPTIYPSYGPWLDNV